MPRIEEDQQGFLTKTKGKGYHVGSYNPLFMGDPESKQKARDVKRAFAEEADHAFFQSVVKIHWLQGDVQQRLQKILNASGKDEISTSGYKSGMPLMSSWGNVGVELQGRSTLAANDMDYIYSGYIEDMNPKEIEKYKSSGIPKRATGFGTSAMGYALDAKSFKGGQRSEIILDNWKPVALVLSSKAMNMLLDAANGNILQGSVIWPRALELAECIEYFFTKTSLPIKNQKGEIQSKESIINLVNRAFDEYDAMSKGSDILTSEGVKMSNSNLKLFIEEVLEEQKRVTGTYGGKTYGASPGSVTAIKKSDSSAKKAVKAGKFAWADNPYAAAQAAHIVATGEPTVKKGTKRKKTAEGDVHEGKQCEQCGTMYEGTACNECGY